MTGFIVLVKFLVLLTLCDALLSVDQYVNYHRFGKRFSSVAERSGARNPQMTMKQIRAMGKTLRKNCQPKNNVADEKIDEIGNGVFIEEKEVMCYMACIMKMANTMKNGKISYEAAIKQADMLLPDEIKEPAKAALTACRKVPESYKDVCESAFYVSKCIYNENPSVFFFP